MSLGKQASFDCCKVGELDKQQAAHAPDISTQQRWGSRDMVKVVAWYDSEWGYSQRVVDKQAQ
jgi:glyceraldehyde-3-phosphate dehydrogenase/erythrose-4-phosphate dehydrogenase